VRGHNEDRAARRHRRRAWRGRGSPAV